VKFITKLEVFSTVGRTEVQGVEQTKLMKICKSRKVGLILMLTENESQRGTLTFFTWLTILKDGLLMKEA
jgi:hypothetical protein